MKNCNYTLHKYRLCCLFLITISIQIFAEPQRVVVAQQDYVITNETYNLNEEPNWEELDSITKPLEIPQELIEIFKENNQAELDSIDAAAIEATQPTNRNPVAIEPAVNDNAINLAPTPSEVAAQTLPVQEEPAIQAAPEDSTNPPIQDALANELIEDAALEPEQILLPEERTTAPESLPAKTMELTQTIDNIDEEPAQAVTPQPLVEQKDTHMSPLNVLPNAAADDVTPPPKIAAPAAEEFTSETDSTPSPAVESANVKETNNTPSDNVTPTINVNPKDLDAISLIESVAIAVEKNPEVQEAYRNYEASLRDKYSAFGGFLPTLDWSLSRGNEKRNDPSLKANYGRTIHSLTLKQMLFDGFATAALVEQFDATTKAQLLTLEDVTNRVANEATRAYINLLRQRQLTEIAEQNYVDLKVLYEQVVLKSKTGVGKKSDVEQALARLALADYNMTVEGSLIHDAEAEFQRVVGFLPPKKLDPALPFKKDIPDTPELAIKQAQGFNPLLLAVMYEAEAQKMTLKSDDALFMPRVDLQFIKNWDKDLNGISTGVNRNDGEYYKDTAEIIFSWNLFNGGKDYQQMKKDIELLVANDERIDAVCRNLRQETAIFYNNILKLTEQESYLDARQLAIEKARDAYRKQFEVGQRTLIDLLNSENELFESQRLYTGVVNDLASVYAETHTRMGTLLQTLGLKRYQDELAPTPSRPDYEVCPATAPKPYEPNRKLLEKRVLEALGVDKLPSEEADNLDDDFEQMTQELE